MSMSTDNQELNSVEVMNTAPEIEAVETVAVVSDETTAATAAETAVAAVIQDVKPTKSKNGKKKKRKGFSLESRRAAAGYVFVLPFIIGFAVFMLYPLIQSLIWSMAIGGPGKDPVTGKGGYIISDYVGLYNYQEILGTDDAFMVAFLETLQRTFIWTPFIVVFSLFIALMLNRKIRFRGVFRVIYFLPVLLGTGLVFQAVSPVMDMLTMPEELTRTISYLLGSGEVATFLNDLLADMISIFWKSGVQIVIFLSGLQGISDTYYEAARVDSANGWDMLWKITIPMLSPMILLNAIYTIIDSFRDEANPIVAYILEMYRNTKWAYLTAMGWMYFLVTLVLLGIVFAVTRRMVFYEK